MSRLLIVRFAALACLVLLAAACGDSREGAPPPPPAATPEPVPPRPTETAPPLPPDGTVPAEPAQPAAGAAPAAAAPAAATNGDPAKGAPLYATYCASCHGPKGCGDGPLSATLNPKPAKHCDGNVMNAEPTEKLFKIVKEGGASVGKSPLMAPWGGTLTDAQIHDVVAFVRTLAVPPYKGS
jgi:mono/diheme cytochrome c family protein